MIIPNGKNKHQVNQGGYKNETIWDSSIFSKLSKEALAPTPDPSSKGIQTPTEMQNSPESQVMQDSNSVKMNPSKIQDSGIQDSDDSSASEQQDKNNGNPENWKYDPQTGAPLAGMSGLKVYEKAHADFSRHNLSVRVEGDINGGNWKVTVSPNTGKQVAKP